MPIYASMVSIALELCPNGDPLSYTLLTLSMLPSLLFVLFFLLPPIFFFLLKEDEDSLKL